MEDNHMMKHLYGVLVALLLATAPVAAQASAQANAGVTPDSALYGLEIALENARTALTFNADAKAKANIDQADERLAEIEAMIEANNSAAAQRAASRYEANVDAAAQAAARIDNDGSEERARRGLVQASEVRAEMQANLARAAQAHAEILERQETRMNASQYAHLSAVFENVTRAGVSADGAIEAKREQSKQRLQVIANIDAQQAEAEAQSISEQTGLQAQIDARENAIGGLLRADMRVRDANPQARSAVQANINASTGADVGVGADVRTQTTVPERERGDEERERQGASAQTNTSADTSAGGASADAGAGITY